MEVVPKVTQEILKGSANEQYACRPWQQVNFEDSETIMVCQGGAIRVSFDNGGNWQTTLEIEEVIDMIYLDEFYRRDRAFAKDVVGHIYVTVSQGREWVEIRKPLEIKKSFYNCIKSHPLSRDYLLLKCDIEYDDYERGNFAGGKVEKTSYISKDFGKSFESILAPVKDYDVTPAVFSHGAECWFAFSSFHSTLSRELIYGLHIMLDIDERGFKKWDKQILFYSPDLGKTSKLVEELRDLSVSQLHILSSGVLVTTVEDEICTQKLWFSTGGPFKEAPLPQKLNYSSFGKPFEDDLGRVLLPVYTTESGCKGKFARLLISDFSKFKLSQFGPIHLNPNGSLRIEKFGNCSGTLLGRIFGILSQDGRAQNVVSVAIPDNFAYRRNVFDKYMNVISFDNGNNWSKLKLMDPSNKYRHLFKSHVDDLEHCSLHIFHYVHSKKNYSMKKIFMAKGVVAHSELNIDGNHCMTFISRDAGATWELAFPFPVYSVFADVGNIIVAIPQQQEKFGDDFYINKVFFSLNAGKTWGQYELKQPVLSSIIEVVASDFSVTVIFQKTEKKTGRVERDRSTLLKLDFLHSLEDCT